MKCLTCGQNSLYESTNSEAIELGNDCILVIRNIPCMKCTECSEIIYSGDVVSRLEAITAKAKELAQDMVVVDYRKAA